MTSPWPLFDLRLRTARLELRTATDEDLMALVAVESEPRRADRRPFAPPPAVDRGLCQVVGVPLPVVQLVVGYGRPTTQPGGAAASDRPLEG
jgi:hypothetical protein